MWRPRDRERFIGGYDPEHEMPDPDRDPRDRWQSDAYRHNARDSRFAYRWNPDRVEGRRFEGGEYDRGYAHGYEHGFDHGSGGARAPYGAGRGIYGTTEPVRDEPRRDDYQGGQFWRDEYRGSGGGYRGSSIYGYGSDRGWDHDRGFGYRDGGWNRDERDYGRGADHDRGPDRNVDRGYGSSFDDDRARRNRR